jgi:hypothetical protein
MFSAILFLFGWISILIILIISYITREKMIKILSRKYPHINIDLGFTGYNFTNRLLGMYYFIISFLTLGSYKNTRLFWNFFVNVDEIDRLNDNELTFLLDRLTKLTSWFIKIFILSSLIWAIGFLYNS